MQSTWFKLAIVAIVLTIIAPRLSSAATLYSNAVPQVIDGNFTGDISQSTPGNGGDNTGGVVFDDVLVNGALNPSGGSLTIDSVTYGILREPGAGAVTLTGYSATTSTPSNASDFTILNNNSVHSFGTFVLPQYTGPVAAVIPVTITPSTPFLIAANTTDQLGYSEIAIGLQFSATNANAWDVSQPNTPDSNIDGAWDYDIASNTNAAYSLTGTGPAFDPIYTTFNMSVVGVPEPSCALLSLGVIMPLIRRKRRTA